MRGARRSQQSAVGLQVEIKFDRMHNVAVHHCASWAIPALVSRPVGGEESNMVTLRCDDDCKLGGGPTPLLEDLSDLFYLRVNDVLELAFGDTVASNPLGLGATLRGGTIHTDTPVFA